MVNQTDGQTENTICRAAWSQLKTTWNSHIAMVLGRVSLLRLYGHKTVFFFRMEYIYWLTHWGCDKMAAILQTAFWNIFSIMKIYEFQLKFHWNLFPRVQLAAWVLIMVWPQTGKKPLSATMKAWFTDTSKCVSSPQWDNALKRSKLAAIFAIFQIDSLAWNCCILIQISWEFVLKAPNNNTPALVYIMVWD